MAVTTTNASATGIIQSDGNLALEHVTVALEGRKSGSDTALSLQATNANRSATIQDSALAGYTHGIQRIVSAGHTLALTIQNTVWDPSGDQLGPASAGTIHEDGDVHVEPALVNLAGGDLRPWGSSAQIDLDTITDPAAYTDLNGTPTVDGNGDGVARPDAGALEYRHRAPTIGMVAAPAGGVAGTALAFSAGVSDADGDHAQARWDFGDGHSATTSSATHAYVSPGTYQGAVTATDEPASPTGARSHSQSVPRHRRAATRVGVGRPAPSHRVGSRWCSATFGSARAGSRSSTPGVCVCASAPTSRRRSGSPRRAEYGRGRELGRSCVTSRPAAARSRSLPRCASCGCSDQVA